MTIKLPHDLPWTPISHNPAILKQVLPPNGEVPPLTQFARSLFQPGQIAPAHSHADMTEVFLVTSGVLTIEVDGLIYTLCEGSLILLHPHEVHELRNESNEELHLTYFGLRNPPA